MLKSVFKLFFLSIFILAIGSGGYAQTDFSPQYERATDETNGTGDRAKRFVWADVQKVPGEDYCLVSGISSQAFTCFGIGVLPSQSISYDEMELSYKFEGNTWMRTDADFYPKRVNRDDLYWTDLLFAPDGRNTNAISIRIILPAGVVLDSLKLHIMQIDFHGTPKVHNTQTRDADCPPYPDVIPRSEWLDPYYTQPYYTPTQIDAHHVVIHHGASPDTYTDGAAVVRSYWNYHVNTLGWSDVGYNYLTDKYGNIYKGRKNSDPQNQDCRGAHAGASNNESIGVNFLGNSDVTNPTSIQLDTVYDLLGWWFNKRGYDPAESANIVLQSGGTGSIPRICGHRDVNIGGTACPGDALYAELPQMRVMTQVKIDACSASPETGVSLPEEWQTEDFTASFTDLDQSGSGLQKKFWQVLDYDGYAWRANRQYGHFNDNVESAPDPDWISQAGTWTENSTHLFQSDEDNDNTNYYIPLRQVDSTEYLYHWQMKIDGSGSNRRAGIHVFCDSADQYNRNNSYMVYYRVDQNKVQIYKYVDNTYYLKTDDNAIVNAGQWHDCKLYYNPSTGKMKAWLDDMLVSEWTDQWPWEEGRHLSLRTGNAEVMYDDIKVYTSRGDTETVNVGEDEAVRYQNPDPATPACRVKSIVLDELNHFSSLAGAPANIDRSLPLCDAVYDGQGQDAAIIYGTDAYPVNWSEAYDVHSGIQSLELALGTAPGLADAVAWTDVSGNTSHTFSDLNLISQEMYYASLSITNNAGLQSIISSDGATVTEEATADFSYTDTDICEGETICFFNESQNEDSVIWYFEGGQPAVSDAGNPCVIFQFSGSYEVSIHAWYGGNEAVSLETITVNIHEASLAGFSVNTTTPSLPDATVTFTNESENATEYFWDFGDGDTSGDISPWHTYVDPGLYTVSLVADNMYCMADTLIKDDYIEVLNGTAVENPGNADFQLYPNPAGKHINLILADALSRCVTIKISDLHGKKYHFDYMVKNKKQVKIDIEQLSSGIYFVELIDGGNIILRKKFSVIK